MIFVGVDPGRKTGFCMYDPHTRQILSLQTFDFWGCISKLSQMKREQQEFKVLIENPNLNRPVFFPKDVPFNEPVKLKKAQDVGRNKEDAYLIIQYCIKYAIPYAEVRPCNPKWKHEEFVNYTKWPARATNEHARDAARLVFGLSPAA